MRRTPRDARILIVAGSTVIQSRLSLTLKAIDGVRLVGEADSLQRGVALARRDTPDLVILDIRLRDGHGIDSIREFKRGRPAPLVAVLTTSSEFPYRERCRERGADYCLDRTRELARLEEIVADLGQERRYGSARPQLGSTPDRDDPEGRSNDAPARALDSLVPEA